MSLRLSLKLGLMLGLGWTARSAGQGIDTNPTLPLPVVIAGVPAPAHPLDWSHYTGPEYCEAVFTRVLEQGPRTRGGDSGQMTERDTLAAMAIGSRCLRRVPMAAVPILLLPRALRLAIALNVDSLIPVLVAQQLVHAHGVATRAAVFDSAVDALTRGQPTTAHVQLARGYVPQVDTLGADALKARVEVRHALLRPAEKAYDVAAELAGYRDIDNLLRKIGPDAISLEDREFINGAKIVTALAIARLQYLTTLKDEDLTKILYLLHEMFPTSSLHGHGGLIGEPAPLVTECDSSISPAGNPTSAVPASGRISVLFFNQGELTLDKGAALRRLREAMPDVAITVITQTTGLVGEQLLTSHPEQETTLLHAQYGTALGRSPVRVCVIASQYQTVDGAHVIALPSAAWKAYSILENTLVVVDPRRVVLAVETVDWKPYGDDLVDFIQRLHAKFASSTPATPGVAR